MLTAKILQVELLPADTQPLYDNFANKPCVLLDDDLQPSVQTGFRTMIGSRTCVKSVILRSTFTLFFELIEFARAQGLINRVPLDFFDIESVLAHPNNVNLPALRESIDFTMIPNIVLSENCPTDLFLCFKRYPGILTRQNEGAMVRYGIRLHTEEIFFY